MSTINPVTNPPPNPTAGQTSLSPAERLVDTFARTGDLDRSVLVGLNSDEILSAAEALSPRQQGLLQGALDAVESTVHAAADIAKTPSQRQAEEVREAEQQMRLSEMRGQAELEMVLAPYEKLDRPPAGLAWAVSVASVIDKNPDRVPREDG